MGPQNSHDQYINGQSLPTSPIFGGQAQYSERDPQGLNASTPGAKLDSGKQRPWLVLRMGFGRALQAVTRIGTKGAGKYSDNGWKSVQNGYARYMEAFGRHQDALDLGKVLDDGLGGTGESHIACMAWNLLAAEEFRLARLAGFPNVQAWHDSLGIGTPPITILPVPSPKIGNEVLQKIIERKIFEAEQAKNHQENAVAKRWPDYSGLQSDRR